MFSKKDNIVKVVLEGDSEELSKLLSIPRDEIVISSVENNKETSSLNLLYLLKLLEQCSDWLTFMVDYTPLTTKENVEFDDLISQINMILGR